MARVRVTFTVDVDLEAWAEEYGLPTVIARRDVQEHGKQMLLTHVRELGMEPSDDHE